MSQNLTAEEQQTLQQAYDAMVAQMAQFTNVLGLACVVITKNTAPITIYAGENEFLAPGIDLLRTRLDEVEIVNEIDALIANVDAKVH